MKIYFLILLTLTLPFRIAGANEPNRPLRIAVEFMDHAAAAQVAQKQGWFTQAGLQIETFDSYITGMALAAALARDEVDAAYICLVPALSARINADIDIRVVSGTHLYGYALVVNPEQVKTPSDLLLDRVRVGCVRPGGAVDVMMNCCADLKKLDRELLNKKMQRMSPPRLVMALATDKLEGIFVPEHYATWAETNGGKVLLQAQDCWPKMTGSVLVVTNKLLKERPDTVKKLVKVTSRSTQWIRENPQEAARIVADWLSHPPSGTNSIPQAMTRADIHRSMSRLEYTTNLDPANIQEIMDYMQELSYIKKTLPLEQIIDTRFLLQ